jgi:hypothetical protein
MWRSVAVRWQPSFLVLDARTRRLLPKRSARKSGRWLEQVRRDHASCRSPSTSWKNVADAGQQEVLNWWPLLGAMESLGAKLEWSEFVQTHVFNSNKVFAIFEAR